MGPLLGAHSAVCDVDLFTVLFRICRFVIVTKWFYLTRLETRTKESNVYASIRVLKPQCAMKVKAPSAEVGTCQRGHYRPIRYLRMKI